MSSKTVSYNFPFSHIYVEKTVLNHPRAQAILDRFSKSRVISIDHYKDVFNRPRQSFRLHKTTPSLILARNTGTSVFPGAPVCQDFGYDHFYYTSSCRNCIFDCEYCFLRGMYGSSDVVVFVNLDDTFSEVEALLSKHPVYLCVSFDTDLIALENLTGYVSAWAEFTEKHPELTIEIRTKSFRKDIFDKIPSCDRVIFAYTLSPQEVIDRFEKRTGTLDERLSAASYAMEKGFPVRLCFDPILYFPDWKNAYTEMIEKVKTSLDLSRIKDVSIGTFRISSEYIKKVRKDLPDSEIVQYPFERHNGVMEYPDLLRNDMENTLITLLQSFISREKIFLDKN